MFDPQSRYVNLTPYARKDHRGRWVTVVPIPSASEDAALGIHLLRQGERLDHLAFRYLGNAAGYWRIAGINGAMLPDALAERRNIIIPATKAG